MKPTINKRNVMKRAWMLYKHLHRQYKTFDKALREAWAQEKRIAIRKQEAAAKATESPRANTDHLIMAGAAAWYRNARPGQYFGD